MSVGLCVVSFNRPEYLEKALKAITKQLIDVVDDLVVVNDGSDTKHNASYGRAYKSLAKWPNGSTNVITLVKNGGVAKAKNAGIEYLLQNPDNEHIFVGEDDITPLHPDAILGYIRAAESGSFHHLSFAHHGPANLNIPDSDGPVSFFPHSVGAWCMYSRKCLEDQGLFDEQMVNAFEHVEHSVRLIRAGYMPGAAVHQFPDATGSRSWLTEIPGSLKKSSIRPRDDWRPNIKASLTYWQKEKPDTFAMLFGEDMPLHNYAMGILA